MIHAVRTDELESMAAAYALGSLAPDETRAFERHLDEDGCEVCRREVAAMREVCGDLALAPTPSAPSPAVRSRVLAEATRERAAATPSALTFLLAADGAWETRPPGVQRRMLAAPRPGHESRSYLIRMEPGSTLQAHPHELTEHCFVIEGDVYVGGRHLHAGDFHLAPRGTRHDTIRSDGGCLFLVVEAA